MQCKTAWEIVRRERIIATLRYLMEHSSTKAGCVESWRTELDGCASNYADGQGKFGDYTALSDTEQREIVRNALTYGVKRKYFSSASIKRGTRGGSLRLYGLKEYL